LILEENTKNSLRKYYREARISAPDKEKMSEIIVSHNLRFYQNYSALNPFANRKVSLVKSLLII